MIEDLQKSRFILGASYEDSPVSLGGDGMGDLWPMTWGADGRVYAGYGDGFGFDSDKNQKKLYCGCVALKADPQAGTLQGRDLGWEHFKGLGFMFSGTAPNVKPTGMLSVAGILYFFVQDIEPDWRFGVCRNVKLYVSSDLGATWQDRGVFFTDTFTTPTFLQFGRDHADNRDGYAYLYSPKYNWFEEDELFLARVPTDKIADRSAYEFFDAVEGVSWSKDIRAMRPVFANPAQYVQQCEVVYNQALQRYILVQWRLGGAQYNPNHDHYSELYMLESPRPWGPWALFHADLKWGVNADDYRYCGRIPADLVGADGKSFYLQYSGWTPVKDKPCTPYNYNLQKMTLRLA